MGDPTKAEPRYANGKTAQENVDEMASGGSAPPSVTRNPVVTAKAPQNIHPSAKGVYGSPVDANPPLSGGNQ